MNLRRLYLFFWGCLVTTVVQSQILTINNGNSLFVNAGTIFHAEGFSLVPSTNFSLSGIGLSKASTPNNNSWGISIGRVYRFNNATAAYTGSLRINYQDTELNGIAEDSLWLNVWDGSCWKSYPAASRNTATNYVEVNIPVAQSLKEVTLGRYIHPGPAIVKQPVDNAITYSCNVPAFSIRVADSSGIPTYQWYSNTSKIRTGGTLISGATDSLFNPAVTAIGTYYYYAVVSSSCGKDTSKAVSLVISAQNANPGTDIYYTGPIMAWTSGSTSNNASVVLSATIIKTLSCGDIRTAKVTFAIRNNDNITYTPITGAQNLPVNFVDPAHPEYGGAASAKVQFTLPSTTSDQVYRIAVIVSGNFTANNPVFDGTLNIARPTPGGLIAGCVKLCNESSSGYLKGATSNGTCAVYTRMGFGVQYSKSFTNPKGVVDITVKSYYKTDGTLDAVLHTYRIKSNSIVSLSVNGSKGTANFTSKSSVTELFSKGTESSIDGNCNLVFDMTDKGDQTATGAIKDSVSLTVYRNKGGVWFSNNWSTALNKTANAAICGGDVNVQGSNTSGSTVTGMLNYNSSLESQPALNVYVRNNPTNQYFRITIKGSDERISIRIVDDNGRLVEVRESLLPGKIIEIGQGYKGGTYFAQVIQGTRRKVVKLIKQ